MNELEHEKALVAEIENCDQQYLNELKITISEQKLVFPLAKKKLDLTRSYSAELEAFRADLAEGSAKLERLEEKLQELNLQKQEATSAIDEAQRLIHIQKNSTRAEVFRLKGIQ
jgi:Knl1 RWD C-terminal domain